MKITALKTSMLRVPNNPPVSTYYRENRYVVARIQTDEGLEGLGYTMLVGGAGAESVREYMEKSLVPQLLGENPLDVDRLWQKMYYTDRGIRKEAFRCTRSARWISVYGIFSLNLWKSSTSSGTKSRCWPIISAANRPNIRSAAGLNITMRFEPDRLMSKIFIP